MGWPQPVNILLLSAATIAWSCDISGTTACSTEFVGIPIQVLTPQGQPASNVLIADTLLRTGDSLPLQQIAGSQTGTYVIFHDGLKNLIRSTGDSVRVTGRSTAGAFHTDFVFDVPGGCHVHKVSGPDVVTLK